MAVIGALFKRQAVRDDIAQQLGLRDDVRFAPDAAALIAAATAHQLDAVMMELQDQSGQSSLAVIEALLDRDTSLRIIVYDQLSPWRVEVLRQILVQRPLVDLILRPCRSIAREVRNALRRSDRIPVLASLLPRLLDPAPVNLEIFLLVAIIKAPTQHNASQLALWSGSTLRTVERRLARAGWASARTVVQAIRALDVVWLMSEYGMSTRQVQAARGFAHPTNIRRLTQRYADVTPAAIRIHNGFAPVLDTVVQRITHRT
jgi:hypothetical protein